MVGTDDAERIAAFHLGDDLFNRLQNVALIVVFEHLRDNLRIGFRYELYAAAHEVLLEVEIILDDAVMHNGKTTALAHLRVRVHIARCAVRRPARVADAERTGQCFAAVQQVAQHAQPAFRFYNFQSVFREDCYTCGVISAVFQLFQPLQENGYCLIVTDITDDSAHILNHPFRIYNSKLVILCTVEI